MSEGKTPFIRLVKRTGMSAKKVWLIRLFSIIIALILGFIPLLITGTNPFEAYGVIISGALSRPVYIKQTIRTAIPLLGCALAIAPCFKMKFWNIGAEGQITMGAVFASYFAINFATAMPHVPLLIVMAISAAIFGGLWALIPAFFKAKWNTNETLFTLMMNYIAIGIVAYLQGGPWEGRKGSQQIPIFNNNAWLPNLFGVHIGWVIVLLLVLFMYFYMNKTKQGYEIAVVGDSVNTARYAGMSVPRIIMRTMLLSGAISGLVGFLVVSGANHTIYNGVAAGVGFTSITVAWLSQLNAFAMIAISMILAILEKGASTLQTRLSVPASIADIITGILLFTMLASEFFINYQIVIRKKDKEVNA